MINIVIRTLGGKATGYGHFYRCLSLGKAINLKSKMMNVIFLINDDLVDLIKSTDFKYIVSNKLQDDYEIIKNIDMDLFILDSYLGNNKYLKMIKGLTELMLIDDNNDIYDSSIPDILYNGNIHSKKLGYKEVENQIRLLGTEYLIMKEEYWNEESIENTHNDGILITTGGSDEHGVALKILEEIQDTDFNIKLIIGPGYTEEYIKRIEAIEKQNIELIYKPNSLKRYICDSKVVITAGGSTVYEVLNQGSIPVVFSIADNQDLICSELEEIGFEYLGKYPYIEYEHIKKIIKESNIKYYNNKNYIINGNGAINIADKLLKKIYK